MKMLLPLAAAALSLAACQQGAPEVVETNPDPMAAELANRPAVELPPAMVAQTTQRCADGSLVYVDFFEGSKQVDVRTEKGGAATRLTAAEAGGAYEAAGGWKLTGTDKNVTLTSPGKAAKSCHT
ncbi:MAG TPA: hypothetical protein VF637_18690 [Sphingomicrobium sp.]